MKTRIVTVATAAIMGLASLTGCKKKIDDIKSNSEVFKASLFKQNLINGLGNKTGYAFVINQDGKLAESGEKGWARMAQDGAVAQSINKPMNVASVTKWLTGVTAVRLMSEKGISMSDSIYKFLPTVWKLGPGIKSVTFDQILRHSAGLTTADIRFATDYKGLKDCIANGVANPSKDYNYSNVNFALFRIMFAYMDSKVLAGSYEAHLIYTQDTSAFDQSLSDYYINTMQKELFTPAGVGTINCKEEARSTATLMYSDANQSGTGQLVGDWTLICGGGGYYMSAIQLAKVMAYVYHSETILTKIQRDMMEANLYGHDGNDSPETAHGRAYGKGGALYHDANNNSTTDASDEGLQAEVMKFPNGVEAVVFVNSLNGGWGNYASIVKNAYNDAWVKE